MDDGKIRAEQYRAFLNEVMDKLDNGDTCGAIIQLRGVIRASHADSLSLESVTARVGEVIAMMGADPETASSRERDLYVDILKALSDDRTELDLPSLATEALRINAYDFRR